MTKKSFKKTDKKGREEEWTWVDTPEATEAIKQLHEGCLLYTSDAADE